jgi:hypothetical protein
MAAQALWALGSGQVIFNSGIDSLANNALALSPVIYPYPSGAITADVSFYGTFASGAPTANTGMSVWFIKEMWSGTYETGSSGVTPVRNPDVSFGFASNQSGQGTGFTVGLPARPFKMLIKNDGTGVTLAPSGNILYMKPTTFQQY